MGNITIIELADAKFEAEKSLVDTLERVAMDFYNATGVSIRCIDVRMHEKATYGRADRRFFVHSVAFDLDIF